MSHVTDQFVVRCSDWVQQCPLILDTSCFQLSRSTTIYKLVLSFMALKSFEMRLIVRCCEESIMEKVNKKNRGGMAA